MAARTSNRMVPGNWAHLWRWPWRAGALVVLALIVAGVGVAQITAVQGLRAPPAIEVPTAAGGVEGPAQSRSQRAAGVVVPPAAAAPGLMWFAPHSRAADSAQATGPGLWRRTAAGDAWEWEALPPDVVTERVDSGAGVPPLPAWPDDSARLQAERVLDPAGRVRGYWVWNAAYFVLQSSGSHRWEPHWTWARSGEPVLLIPEVCPFEPDGPAYRAGIPPQLDFG